MILPHRLGYPIMSNWRSIVTVTPLLPNSAHKRSASCFSFAAALPICDAPRRIMCMLGGGNSMIRDRQPTVCVTRWEWKCWRGCVYPKASSAHSPGKSTNESIPIPLHTEFHNKECVLFYSAVSVWLNCGIEKCLFPKPGKSLIEALCSKFICRLLPLRG